MRLGEKLRSGKNERMRELFYDKRWKSEVKNGSRRWDRKKKNRSKVNTKDVVSWKQTQRSFTSILP